MTHEPGGPDISQESCNLCGACIGVCVHGALVIEGNRLQWLAPEGCDDCGACEEACPQGAISCGFEIVWRDPDPGGDS